jgi:transposase
MSTTGPSVSPNSRRYTPEEKAQAVRLVRALRTELGTTQGTVGRIADQLGYGRETVRKWVREDDIANGGTPTTAEQATAEARRIAELEQEVRELRRANSILKSASAFFAAELDRPSR